MAPAAGGVRRKASGGGGAGVRRTLSGGEAARAGGAGVAKRGRRGTAPRPAAAAAAAAQAAAQAQAQAEAEAQVRGGEKPRRAKAGRGGWGFLFGGKSSKKERHPLPLPDDWALEMAGNVDGLDGLSLFSPKAQVPARSSLHISPRTHAAIASASLRQGTLGILQAAEPAGPEASQGVSGTKSALGVGSGLAGRTEALVNAKTEIKIAGGGRAEMVAPRLYASDIGSASFAQGGAERAESPPALQTETEALGRSSSRRVQGEGTTILVYDDRPPIFIPHMDFSVLPNHRKQYRSSLFAHGIKIMPVQSPGRFACLGLGKI